MNTTPLFLIGAAAVLAAAVAPAPMLLARAGPVALGAQPSSIMLAIPTKGSAKATGRRIRLVFSDLSAKASPGVLYQVSLNDPSHTLGYINFYNVVTGGPASFSFDVDKTLIDAAPNGGITVILSPQGAPDINAHTTIGKIALLAY